MEVVFVSMVWVLFTIDIYPNKKDLSKAEAMKRNGCGEDGR
jgi:hypothetical protein